MTNVAIDDMAFNLRHFKPLKLAQRFRGRFDALLNGVLNTGF